MVVTKPIPPKQIGVADAIRVHKQTLPALSKQVRQPNNVRVADAIRTRNPCLHRAVL